MPAMGRGRGRSRGKETAEVGQQKTPGPKTQNLKRESDYPSNTVNPVPSTSSEKSVTISSIVDKMDCMSENEMLMTLPNQIESMRSEENINELVNTLCEKALLKPEFGSAVARLFNAIWVRESMHAMLRKPLLNAVQEKYTHRDAKQRTTFYGLCTLLCELYKVLRLQGKLLKPLTNPVCELLQELLRTRTDATSSEDVFFFFQELENIGHLIETDSKEKMENIMTVIRQFAISGSASPSVRCRLIQLIELRATGWRMNDEMRIMYEDMISDLMLNE